MGRGPHTHTFSYSYLPILTIGLNLRSMFGKTKGAPELELVRQLEQLTTKLAALEASVDELRTNQESLGRRWQKIDVEWSEWFDKYRRLYARISKRQQRDEKTPENGSGDKNAVVGDVGPPQTDNPLAQRILGMGG